MTDDPSTWADALDAAIARTDAALIERAVVLTETASTQDAALQALGSSGGVAALAAHQTKGRGQRGAPWTDDPTASLAISFAFRTNLPAVPTAARAGLAALDTCRAAAPGAEIAIKWPNDIVAGTHKLAGVLVERHDHAAVIGVGINVAHTPDQLDALPRATSLAALGSRTTRIDAACNLLEHLTAWMSATDDAVRAHWSQHDALRGTERTFVQDNQTYTGTVESIDPLDHIALRTDDAVIELPVASTRNA